jgi:hypothetical protein
MTCLDMAWLSRLVAARNMRFYVPVRHLNPHQEGVRHGTALAFPGNQQLSGYKENYRHE